MNEGKQVLYVGTTETCTNPQVFEMPKKKINKKNFTSLKTNFESLTIIFCLNFESKEFWFPDPIYLKLLNGFEKFFIF